MQIKGRGINPADERRQSRTGTGRPVQSDGAFLNLLRREGKASSSPSAAGREGVTAGEIAASGALDAVSTRARIQTGPGRDVTDFLELVAETHALLRGMADGDAVSPDAPDGDAVRPLTDAETRALRERYDTDDLPPHRQATLLRELTQRGVLSADDVRKTRSTVAPQPDSVMGYLLEDPAFLNVEVLDPNRPKERLDAMIHNERHTCRHVESRYGMQCGAVQALAEAHQRVLDTLRQIG